MSASDKVIEAARAVIEMEDGEKGYIVHSDLIAHLEGAVAEYDKRRAAMRESMREATGG